MNGQWYAYQDYDTQPDPPHQPLYLRKVLRGLRSDSTVERVLDAGCGDGNFAESLAHVGYTVYGIDMSPSGIRIAQERNVGTFRIGSLYDDLLVPFGTAESFDAIVCVEVIEHLYSPRTFLNQAFDALRPGGLLIITTPYWGYLKNVVLAVTNRIDNYLTVLWDGGHIKHFSRRTLQTMVQEQGLDVVSFDGDDIRRIPFLWMGMIMVFRKPFEGDRDGG